MTRIGRKSTTDAGGNRTSSGVRSRVDGARVLIVDDEEDNRDLFATFLGDRGYEIETAGDGEQAVVVAERFLPDVIIMDIAMPDLDGWEAARRIRQSSVAALAKSFIIVLTAFGDGASRRRTVEAGCDMHLVKPIRPDELADHVAAALARGASAEKSEQG